MPTRSELEELSHDPTYVSVLYSLLLTESLHIRYLMVFLSNWQEE